MQASHQHCTELLPWYVNDSLPAAERDSVEQHLRTCLICNAAVREGRQLQTLLRQQDTVPLGPGHGIHELQRRIDQRSQAVPRWLPFRSPVLRYGIAAGFGGLVVALLVLVSGSSTESEFGFQTLTSVTDQSVPRIDVIFVAPPSGDELEQFVAEAGIRFIGGPSEVGRYTFAVETGTESAVAAIVERLNTDPRISLAARSYAAEPASGVGQ